MAASFSSEGVVAAAAVAVAVAVAVMVAVVVAVVVVDAVGKSGSCGLRHNRFNDRD